MLKKIIIGILSTIGLFYILITVYFSVFVDCYIVQKGAVASPDEKYVVKYNLKTCEDNPPKIEIWLKKRASKTSTLIFSAIATTTEAVQLDWTREEDLNVIYPKGLNPTNTNNLAEYVSVKFRTK